MRYALHVVETVVCDSGAANAYKAARAEERSVSDYIQTAARGDHVRPCGGLGDTDKGSLNRSVFCSSIRVLLIVRDALYVERQRRFGTERRVDGRYVRYWYGNRNLGKQILNVEEIERLGQPIVRKV